MLPKISALEAEAPFSDGAAAADRVIIVKEIRWISREFYAREKIYCGR